MGYAFYFVGERAAGYGVLATCDKRGCDAEIDRGLGYLCGDEPHGPFDEVAGCGRYFCGDHLGLGCHHQQGRSWGETLACMVQDDEGTYCLSRRGHDGLHAWAMRDAAAGLHA